MAPELVSIAMRLLEEAAVTLRKKGVDTTDVDNWHSDSVAQLAAATLPDVGPVQTETHLEKWIEIRQQHAEVLSLGLGLGYQPHAPKTEMN